MDLILYIIFACILGFAKISKAGNTENVVLSNEVSLEVVQTVDMPIASNLGLVKEADAYMLILYELGLR